MVLMQANLPGRAAIVTLPAAPAAPAAPATTLLLTVEVNGYSIHQVGEFILRDGLLSARRSELQELGFRVPDIAPAGPDALIALSALPGLTVRLDMAAQSVAISVSDDLLLPTLLDAGGRRDGSMAIESGTGAVLEYDVSATSAGGRTLADGVFDLRVFSPVGVISTGVLAYSGGHAGPESMIRLDSTYSFADVRSLRRYRLGDFITGSLPWTRPIRLGGAQVSLDFGIRPDLITFPLPSVSGSVAVPSTVDVLVNGTQLVSQQIHAGPFSLPQLPVVTGVGTISTTLTNALGRQVVTTLNFYASAALLAPGLQSFSLQAGAVRRNWGLISNDYSSVAATANYRRGLSSRVTAEAAAEANRDVVMAGGGIVVNVADFALANAAFAGSYGHDPGTDAAPRRAGGRFAIGVQHEGASLPLSLSASLTLADRNFRDVAAVNGDPVSRLEINASAGLRLGRFGSVGIAYAMLNREAAYNPVDVVAPINNLPGENGLALAGSRYRQHAQIVTANYSVSLGRIALYATVFQDLTRRGSSAVQVGLTIPLGARTSASVSGGGGSGSSYGQVQASRSPDTIGDFGFQASTSFGASTHAFGELQYKSPWALLTAGIDQLGPQTSVRAQARGAVSFVEHELFLSNSINDSFAVVDTNGLANVHVLAENRAVGVTGRSGRLLVPELRSFEVNRLAIDPDDVPSDSSVVATAREVRPQDRSGVVVKFAVRSNHGAVLHLVDDRGKDLPMGSTVTLAATGVTVPVGYDGVAYVEDLSDNNNAAVLWPDGKQCSVTFKYRPVAGDIPSIGPLHCMVPIITGQP